MRLDKYLSLSGLLSRRETAAAVRHGDVLVNGAPATRADAAIDEARDSVTLRGTPVTYRPTVWVMLNKPAGYVSATEDGKLPVVTELLPEEYRRRGLFPVGRLDRDTVGLMLLTDDGALAHLLLSPKRHVTKRYRFSLSLPLPEDAEARCLAGIPFSDFVSKPATLLPDEGRTSGEILLTEGKYHEIKRMMHAMGTEVTALARLSFAGIELDPALSPGAWRDLTDDEIALLQDAAATKNVSSNTGV